MKLETTGVASFAYNRVIQYLWTCTYDLDIVISKIIQLRLVTYPTMVVELQLAVVVRFWASSSFVRIRWRTLCKQCPIILVTRQFRNVWKIVMYLTWKSYVGKFNVFYCFNFPQILDSVMAFQCSLKLNFSVIQNTTISINHCMKGFIEKSSFIA